MHHYSIAEISQLVGIPYQGAPTNLMITGIASLREAKESQISFLDQIREQKYLAQTKASAIILKPEWLHLTQLPVLITSNPYLIYAKVAELFNNRPLPEVGIHPTAVIGKNCQIDASARIGAYCVIGNDTVIGPNCILWPQVTLYDQTQLGHGVVIHSGAVIGSDGFGNAHDGKKWVAIPQLGKVIIHNQVCIGANTTIDRGTLGDTIIEEGVRLDNQIQIAHNVRIGAHTAIAACTGIAGSTTIGKHCMIGGGVGITGHISICDQVMIAAKAGISKSITKPGVYAGSIAQDQKAWQKMTARLRHLDALFSRVKQLEDTICQTVDGDH